MAFDLESCGLENGVQLSEYRFENTEKSTYIQSEYPYSVSEHLCSASKQIPRDYPPCMHG